MHEAPQLLRYLPDVNGRAGDEALQHIEQACPEASEEQRGYHRLLFDATNEALLAATDKVRRERI